jgi:hypothetical protein
LNRRGGLGVLCRTHSLFGNSDSLSSMGLAQSVAHGVPASREGGADSLIGLFARIR